MKKILFIFIVAMSLYACTTEPEIAYNSASAKVDVAVQFIPEATEQITRAADESGISDLNIYLFGKTNGQKIHIYTRSSLVDFKCLPGEYDLYVAANIHEDLGDKTATELGAYALNYKETYADLPMSVHESITVPLNQGGTVVLPAIKIRRNVAKIAYNLVVDKLVNDIRLASIQVVNIPCGTAPFRDSVIPPNVSEGYMIGKLESIPAINSGTYSGVSYLYENLQGRVASITNQSQKSSANAPKYATYLHIRATRGAKALAYTVYLGENNTDNFDVRRNTYHTLNITIKGDNEIDTRVSSYTLSVWDDIGVSDIYNGYCVQNSQKSLHIDVQGKNNTLPLHAKIKVTKGEVAGLNLDGAPIGADGSFYLPQLNEKNVFELDYDPKLFNSAAATLAFTVTIYDDYGISQSFNFEHRYANQINTLVSTAGYTNGKGSVTASGALYTQQTSGTTNVFTLCNENGCTLTATPALGYKFVGWYADPAFTKLLSASATYSYKPSASSGTLYVKFALTDDTPLDKKGTANCYIAKDSGVWYSFNATVMGNGKTTKNITPKRLSGTDAKVIWEMGKTSGIRVIESVIYDNGRIYFKTGSMRGNAVIGLFDNAGNCLWSWHIWMVAYAPETAGNSETYGSGAVFMNRNLGAITTDYNDQTARGMYYQWGRKDPFPYPSVQVYGDWTLKPTYCLNEYDFTLRSNKNGTEPQSIYTIEWATAHPTAFLTFAPAGVTWMSKINYNLWGNATDGTTATTTNTKTIYDPCPPGWKVPAPEAWDKTYFKKASNITNYGWYMYYANNTNQSFFRYSGFLDDGYDKLQFLLIQGTNQMVRLWSNSPWIGSSKDQANYLYILDSGVTGISNAGFQHHGYPVRCVKE